MPCEANPLVGACPGPNQAAAHAAQMCAHCRDHSCKAPVKAVACRGPNGPAVGKCSVCRGKTTVAARRQSIQGKLQAGETAEQLQAGWTQRAVTIVEGLYQEAFGGVNPAFNYAFCITGSGARREACPYSDLDCFIVLEAAAGPAQKQAMIAHSRTVRDQMIHIQQGTGPGDKGFTFCVGGLNPGGWNAGGAPLPQLTGTAVELSEVMETNLVSTNELLRHMIAGLQESAFGFGTPQLHRDFCTEVDRIMGQTCWKWHSRPHLTYLKRTGLDSIKNAVRDSGPGGDFAIPDVNSTRFNLKKGFYRLPQFVVKGLAWYYGITLADTASQLVALEAGGRLHANKAAVFRTLLGGPLVIRVASHLSAQHESDFVRTAAHPTADGNPNHEMILTQTQLQTLQDAVPFLQQVRTWSQEFVRQKEKFLGKRVNPFASANPLLG